MVQKVIQNSPSDLLDAIVKSLDGMADDDTRYFEELENELKEKDELINDKEKTINTYSAQNKILLREILKYNPNFAL